MKILNFKKKNIIRGLAVSIVVAVLIDISSTYGLFKGAEYGAFDIRSRLTGGSRIPHEDIVLILIDEASLKAMNRSFGRWPWPRSVYGDLIEFLKSGGANKIVFDVLFTENEKDVYKSTEPGLNDRILVEATASAGNVYHSAQILIDDEDQYNTDLLNRPMPDYFVDKFSVKNLTVESEVVRNNNFYLPFDELSRVSRRVGIVEFTPDRDGVFRRTKLLRGYKSDYFPVMSMAVLLDMIQPDKIVSTGNKIDLEKLAIPLDEDGNYLINMYKNFNLYSISGIFSSIQNIYSGDMEKVSIYPDEFKDKIVIIGASAGGVEDLKATSLDNRMPGVFLHASIISNVLKKDFLRIVPKFWNRIILYGVTISLGLLLMLFSSLFIQIISPPAAALFFTAVSFLTFENNLVIETVPLLVSVFIAWLSSFIILYFLEGRHKRNIRRMLGQYVSPAVLMDIVDGDTGYIRAEVGTKERLTIMFSDIRGFTSMSERMNPEHVVAMLNEYLSAMVDIIFSNKGTLDKFIGDALMIFWGAPIRLDNHGTMAVKAALEMRAGLKEVNEEFSKKGYPPIATGIGIHTGDVILGNIGSEKKLDYTIIGDHVNLTSRIEGLTKIYGCDILISEATFIELGSQFICRVVDCVRVRGKEKSIKLFTVIGFSDDEAGDFNRKISRKSDAAFEKYLSMEFKEASDIYKEINTSLKEDKISDVFINRCAEYLREPPPSGWDGVYSAVEKNRCCRR